MGKTIIKIECKDQKLHLLNPTVIASGGRNEDLVEFSFCPLWDGFEKYVAFYRNRRTVYRVPIVDNQCIIPQEVLAEGGWISIAVFGTNGDILRTSDELKYHIKPGAPTSGIDPSEPTPDLWEQVLNRPIYWDNIANKPFGIETVKGFILPESQPETRTGFGYIYTQPVAELVVGETYTISVNGIEGDFVAQETPISGVNHVGFLASSNAGWAGSEFYIWRLNEDKIAETGAHWTTGTYDGTSIEAVSIYGKMTTFKKIPKEYLPDDIGNSGGVSSWNDLTDKPFGEVDNTSIIPKITLTPNENGEAAYTAPLGDAPVVGEMYLVDWNGIEYICTGQSTIAMGVDAVALGNFGGVTGGENTGEPFVIILSPDMALGVYAAIAVLDGSAEITVSVHAIGETKLPAKYYPVELVPVMFVHIMGEIGNVIDGWTANKTFADVAAAVKKGYMIFFKITNVSEGTTGVAIMPLISMSVEGDVGYMQFSYQVGSRQAYIYAFKHDNTFEVSGT